MNALTPVATSPQTVSVQFGPLTLVGIIDEHEVIWINFRRSCDEFQVSVKSQESRAKQLVLDAGSCTAFFTVHDSIGRKQSMMHLKVADFSAWMNGMSLGPLTDEIRPIVLEIRQAGREALEAKFFGTKNSKVHVPAQIAATPTLPAMPTTMAEWMLQFAQQQVDAERHRIASDQRQAAIESEVASVRNEVEMLKSQPKQVTNQVVVNAVYEANNREDEVEKIRTKFVSLVNQAVHDAGMLDGLNQIKRGGWWNRHNGWLKNTVMSGRKRSNWRIVDYEKACDAIMTRYGWDVRPCLFK